jgi:ankyrin repeat protein
MSHTIAHHDADNLMPLFRAIAAGDDSAALRMLDANPRLALERSIAGATRGGPGPFFLREIGHYVYAGATALHIAAASYRAQLVRALVARAADPRARDRRGSEPLHLAASGGPGTKSWNPAAQVAAIDALIAAGADPNAMTKGGVTPLHTAVRTRCAAAVRALLDRGADPRRKNGSGSTPLHLAVQNTGRGGSGSVAAREQQREIVRVLLAHGARLTDKDGRGSTVRDRIRSPWLAEVVAAASA